MLRLSKKADYALIAMKHLTVHRDRGAASAREIAEHTAPVSIALTRALLWHGLSTPDPQTALLADSKCIFWSGQQKDAYEGVMSFLEKRAPKWQS